MVLQTRKLGSKTPQKTTLQKIFDRIEKPSIEDFGVYSFLRNCDDRESELFKATKRQLELVFYSEKQSVCIRFLAFLYRKGLRRTCESKQTAPTSDTNFVSKHYATSGT